MSASWNTHVGELFIWNANLIKHMVRVDSMRVNNLLNHSISVNQHTNLFWYIGIGYIFVWILFWDYELIPNFCNCQAKLSRNFMKNFFWKRKTKNDSMKSRVNYWVEFRSHVHLIIYISRIPIKQNDFIFMYKFIRVNSSVISFWWLLTQVFWSNE